MAVRDFTQTFCSAKGQKFLKRTWAFRTSSLNYTLFYRESQQYLTYQVTLAQVPTCSYGQWFPLVLYQNPTFQLSPNSFTLSWLLLPAVTAALLFEGHIIGCNVLKSQWQQLSQPTFEGLKKNAHNVRGPIYSDSKIITLMQRLRVQCYLVPMTIPAMVLKDIQEWTLLCYLGCHGIEQASLWCNARV